MASATTKTRTAEESTATADEPARTAQTPSSSTSALPSHRTHLERIEARIDAPDAESNIYLLPQQQNRTEVVPPGVLEWMNAKAAAHPSRRRSSAVVMDEISESLTTSPKNSRRRRNSSSRRSSRSKRPSAGSIRTRSSLAKRSQRKLVGGNDSGSTGSDNRRSILEVLEEIASAIKIQSMGRRYLARQKFKNLQLKREYARHVEMQAEQRRLQEAELALLESQIDDEIRQMEDEIREMEDNVQAETKVRMMAMEKETLEKIETDQALPEIPVDQEMEHMGEVDQLEDQLKKLKRSKGELERKVGTMAEENDKLDESNKHINEMFDSLNDFAKKAVEEKKELLLAQKTMIEEAIPKAQQECAHGAQSCTQEMRVVEVYRRCMYEHLRILQSDSEPEIVEEAARLIEECEKRLGNSPMPLGGNLTDAATPKNPATNE